MAELFRKSSLDKLSNPEQLDRMITISSPMSWIALIGVSLVIVVVIIWSFIGSLPSTVTVYGMVTDSGNILAVYSDKSGILKTNKKIGDTVKKGDELARIKTADGKEEILLSSVSGKISENMIQQDEHVFVGTEIMRVTPEIDDKQVFVCYISATEAVSIKEGMKTTLYFMSSDSQKYGHINAEIFNVGDYPVNIENVSYQVGTQNLIADQFLSNGPVVAVVCRIKSDISSIGGYNSKSLPNGTFLSAKIITDESAPITKLLNGLKEKVEG